VAYSSRDCTSLLLLHYALPTRKCDPEPATAVLIEYFPPNHTTYDPLLRAIGNAQVVLIGDGSHGTYDLYAHRANINKRLIEERGFSVIALEADWPDAFRVNSYARRGGPHGVPARDALSDFERFPRWMWRNEVMPPFLEWLRKYNVETLGVTNDPSNLVSIYGMDLYSLHRSADEVIKYLDKVDPEGAIAARKRYNCFERFDESTIRYAYEAQFGLSKRLFSISGTYYAIITYTLGNYERLADLSILQKNSSLPR